MSESLTKQIRENARDQIGKGVSVLGMMPSEINTCSAYPLMIGDTQGSVIAINVGGMGGSIYLGILQVAKFTIIMAGLDRILTNVFCISVYRPMQSHKAVENWLMGQDHVDEYDLPLSFLEAVAKSNEMCQDIIRSDYNGRSTDLLLGVYL